MAKAKKKKLKRWDELLRRIPQDRPVVGAEVGVWRGKMSAKLLKARPDMTLLMVDRWLAPPPSDSYYDSGSEIARMGQNGFESAYADTVQAVRFAGKRAKILRMDSAEAAGRVASGTLDFVFIDGDHSFEGCMRDIRLWMPKIRSGGLISGHDYDHPDQGDVKEAVDHTFSQGVELGENRTWFVTLR